MLDSKVSGNKKECATCNFWGGQRTSDPRLSPSIVMIDARERADCFGQNKSTRGSWAGSSSCSGWQKWGQVRS